MCCVTIFLFLLEKITFLYMLFDEVKACFKDLMTASILIKYVDTCYMYKKTFTVIFFSFSSILLMCFVVPSFISFFDFTNSSFINFSFLLYRRAPCAAVANMLNRDIVSNDFKLTSLSY